MSRIKFCLITPYDEDLIKNGHDISCRDHRHISRNEWLKMSGGGMFRYNLEDSESARKLGQITFPYKPIAEPLEIDGKQSNKYLVLRQDRHWRQVNGCMQFVPIGGQGRSNGNRYKVKCKAPRAPHCKIISKGIS